MKKVLKAILIVLLVIIIAVGGLLGWLTATEFKPQAVEKLLISGSGGHPALKSGQELNILCWNIGYAGLGAQSDFFMDGGKESRAADKDQVIEYLNNIKATVDENAPDLLMLQEVDSDSGRTYRIDQRPYFAEGEDNTAYAMNYACDFVPIPIPPIGRVHSGLYTAAYGYEIAYAERIALPCPFTWPMSTANLKRCLLVSYLPIEGSEAKLVLVNLHLEAYDDGEGKIAQTKQLRDFIKSEYEKGNYVIAGGDFNQIFPGGLEAYPNEHPQLWTPGILTDDILPEGWSFAYDLTVPSCRLLNQPYNPADTANTQHYVIDGFILSPNVELGQVQCLDLGFADSDHNPVSLRVTLG